MFQDQNTATRKTTTFRAFCPGPLWLLSTRRAAYLPGLIGKSQFNTAAASIARQLVRWNASADAVTSNGRLRNGRINGLSVETDTGGGPVLQREYSFTVLLNALQELASATQADFDLQFVPRSGQQPCGWLFRWYEQGCGIDRSEEISLSLDNGCLSQPELAFLPSKGKNAVFTACPDGSGGRLYQVSEGNWTMFAGDPYPEGRTAEAYAFFSGELSVNGLQSRGEGLLEQLTPHLMLSFQVLPTQAAAFGRDYFLGDRVTVAYNGSRQVKQIRQVVITLAPEGKEIMTLQCR